MSGHGQNGQNGGRSRSVRFGSAVLGAAVSVAVLAVCAVIWTAAAGVAVLCCAMNVRV